MTRLVRDALRHTLSDPPKTAHAGLLLQRGFPEHQDDVSAKGKHIAKVCKSQPDDYYCNAFKRWQEATADEFRFHAVELRLKNRMFIGLASGGMLETGCAIGHSYGMPIIPGSSVKGVVSAYARGRLGSTGGGNQACDELFGSGATQEHPAGLAGLISFHDAWWVPGSAAYPLVPEVVTTHHPGYYASEGGTPATDCDSPVPNAQVAVQGSFRLVLEGPCGWLPLSGRMLIGALSEMGIGAKTRAGYGLFAPEPEQPKRDTCPWVDDEIEKLAEAHNASAEEILRGGPLSKAWREITDPELKAAALADIRARWEELGFWDAPRGKAARQAKEVYEAGQ